MGSILLFVSTFLFGGEITLIKQWHLSPGAKTQDIIKSIQLPQFTNQYHIYQSILALVESGKINEVVSEGCEGDIRGFAHGGWGYKDLKNQLKNKNYSKIMALIPLKLKVKLGKRVNVICGDDLKLMTKHQLAFSNLRGFVMYMHKLLETRKSDQKKFKIYSKAMLNGKKIDDPINYAREKALKALGQVKNLLSKRNSFFVNSIKNLKNPVIIIGGLHVEDLKKKLESIGHTVKIVTPKGYQPKDEKLLALLEKQLSQNIQDLKVELFQVPLDFQLNKFPINNLIDWNMLATESEQFQLKKIAVKNKLRESLLRSDFDGDGIRDFTLSTMGARTILAAEDNDWDNDGINNLIDSTIGKVIIAEPTSRILIINSYGVKKIDQVRLLESIENRGLKLIMSNGVPFELLTLVLLDKILEKFSIKKFNLSIIHSTKPVVSYGLHSFFSYVTQSQTIEVYTDKLNDYMNNLIQTSYKGASLDKIVNGLAMPIMLHSLGHELGHALKYKDPYQLAKEEGWTWQEEKVRSLYLQRFRMKKKIMKFFYRDFSFRGINEKNLFKEKKQFEKSFNLLVKGKKNIGKKEWQTGTKSKQPEFQMSLLRYRKLPSYYSITKPTEWFAEVFSTCIFRQFIPDSINLDQSTRYEILIGLRVDVVSEKICKTLL